ncbi:PREDICTED: BAG family molecular chaperone regulator 1-like [Amphimedon queenslandica]|uniref:Uncharacterized protein n=1 Tax=Amphimedon queenslandica TaxID=400682 RepID=A0AAN0JZJ0_AMPQE|nr:PREDICTED: BAG family molecular chaperone regulator 1-like [Amphimedon queenslandica]|eukprot:XP_019862406.1 PREDICTED: BAG family molecular chaperone regulator 1-like [Amphimedon queenslandica]
MKEDELVRLEAGIKNNSKIMLLGRKTDPAQDECLKKLDDISESTNTIERKIKKIEQELEGIEKENFGCIKLSFEASTLMTQQLL